ncbi:MAG: metallophosphoesterase, partial [Oscillospiraceae bacterium]|nr:metallophosphoesterase [Oscillospiraceae bacterium]
HMEQTTQNYHFEESFNVLLVHRPEYIEQYAKLGFDLVLCGHAHGGQWRIPGVLNGIYAPGQGVFPKYAGGIYEVNGTTLVVSRGLAKESTPIPRVFNRPELVIIDII